MEKITTVGIDLAKRVFSLHGVDGSGHVVLRKTVRREQLLEVVAVQNKWGQCNFSCGVIFSPNENLTLTPFTLHFRSLKPFARQH